MPLTIPNGHGIAAWIFSLVGDAEPIVTTCGMRPIGVEANQADCNRMFQAFATHMMTDLVNQLSLQRVEMRVSDGQGNFTLFTSTQAAVNGGSTAPGLPSNCAMIVRKLTARAGKRGVGRFFVPGVREADYQPNGAIDTATLNGWTTRVNNFFAALSAPTTTVPVDQDPVQLTVQHNNTSRTTRTPTATGYTIEHVRGAAGPAPDDVTSLRVDPLLGTQRRRMR